MTTDLRLLEVNYATAPTDKQAPVYSSSTGKWAPGSIANSVTNSDGTLTISPTTGTVVASINLSHANTWLTGQQITAASASNVPLTLNLANSQTANALEIKNNSGTILNGFRSDGSLLIQNSTSTTIVSDGYYSMSAKADGAAANCAFIVDRNRSQTNAGNGVGIFLKDSTSYVGMRMWSNTFVQNQYDYEFISQVGKVMTMPFNGGINIFNPVVNTQDISCMQVPTQTIYAGAGAADPGGMFVFNAPTLAATSPNTLNDTGTLLIKGAPIAGTNMTLTRAHAALFYTGRAGAIGLGIVAHSSQTANLIELKDSSNNVMAYLSAIGALGVRQGGATAGTYYAKVGGTIFDHYVNSGNVGTGEDDLYSDTIPANSLDTDGHKLTAIYSFQTASSASTKQIRLRFAGTLVWDSTALSPAALGYGRIEAHFVRTSSSSVRYSIYGSITSAAGVVYYHLNTHGALTGLTLTGTNILKLTGEAAGGAAATDDIIGVLSSVNWKPSA